MVVAVCSTCRAEFTNIVPGIARGTIRAELVDKLVATVPRDSHAMCVIVGHAGILRSGVRSLTILLRVALGTAHALATDGPSLREEHIQMCLDNIFATQLSHFLFQRWCQQTAVVSVKPMTNQC